MKLSENLIFQYYIHGRLFPGGPVAKDLCFQCRGPWVLSLVGKLRSHMPCGQKIKENKQTKDILNCLQNYIQRRFLLNT